eukprot:GGOE01023921.1.p2 GENE.GGOE01023921.1~~GGOE01023921.1.p2  ORF type:complete len:149 (-),score=44.35 GGOE01023921.1:547-957(-)
MATVEENIQSADIVVFSSPHCPYCKEAIKALKGAGYDPKVVEARGKLREELEARTNHDSVPQVFVKGTFIGGCNDGGLGGTLPLLRNGKLKAMMAEGKGAVAAGDQATKDAGEAKEAGGEARDSGEKNKNHTCVCS